MSRARFRRFWLFLTCPNAWKISHSGSPAFPRWKPENLCRKTMVWGLLARGTRQDSELKVAGDTCEEKPCPGIGFLREGGTKGV